MDVKLAVTLSEEHRLRREFENRELSTIFVTGGDCTMRSFNDLYSSPNNYSGRNIPENEMGGTCVSYGGEQRCLQGFGGEILDKETVWKTQTYMGI